MAVERRLTHKLVDYWHLLKGEDILPAESAIDSDDIADMWEDCFLLRPRGDAGFDDAWGFHYHYKGPELKAVFVQPNPEADEQLLVLPPEKIIAVYQEMALTKLPIVEEVEDFSLAFGQIKYRMCLLPMGDPEEGVIESIFGGMRYKLATCD